MRIDAPTEPYVSPCSHARTSAAFTARASEIFASPELKHKRLHIWHPALLRCESCGLVFLPRGTDGQTLEAGCVALARGLVRPTDSMTIAIGRDGASLSRGELEAEPSSSTSDEFHVTIPRFRLTDVILPASTATAIDEVLIKLRYHELIYAQWGFESVDPSGRGARLNFYGPPGTGKTRAAEAIAGELGKGFLAVTAADMESRYMGETPKRIQSVFEAARDADAVLFFDEADSLFGKRASDVTQGVDHEINAAKSTLLVEVEKFEGVLILASNFQGNFDRAFVRRIAHHIHFRAPDAEARRRLWNYHLVEGVPLDEERDTLLEHLVECSEGLTGGDVLTSLRLALPACIRTAPDRPLLTRAHLEDAVVRVQKAKRDIGRDLSSRAESSSLPWLGRVEARPAGPAVESTEPSHAPSNQETLEAQTEQER
jgi:hypothetical protein